MFLAVTLNPALDKTLCVDRNAPQETLRATEAIDLAGGKGINVARALTALGARVRNLAPLGGFAGAYTAALARAEGMEMITVPIAGRTRTAITIRDRETGRYWHYLEPGPELRPKEQDELRAAFLRAAEGCRTAIVSGSLPCREAAGLLAWLIRKGNRLGLRTALDSFGPEARPALEAGPWLAKPNLAELEATLEERLESEASRWAALERLAGWGVRFAVLSLGAEGALALVEGVRYRVLPPPVAEVNDLGGGDSMVAGLCWAAQAGYNPPEALAWGAACGAANAEVWDPGGISRERVEALRPAVRVERIEP